ncbi:superoxide dismutase [Clostridium massiliodielmoense]|uniref:superoxide dismutase n=1 Tax=Clostridium massiliodielmoense TaxID=1776385 RepID=UPI000A2708BA|nr:superoxide dismutase [Clostridium massiliodielmoense]
MNLDFSENTKCCDSRTAFMLTPLPYGYDHLEPAIGRETVTIHHDKHQQAYVDKLNAAISKHPEFFKKGVFEILSDLNALPEDIKKEVINNGGGVFNHEFYWSILGSKALNENSNLAKAITRDFGSFEAFKDLFTQTGITTFGSGWAWLVSDATGKLSVVSTSNQDCPISEGKIPILTMDVWEHAYYLQYQNRRPEYITNFFNIIDWSKCEQYYDNI